MENLRLVLFDKNLLGASFLLLDVYARFQWRGCQYSIYGEETCFSLFRPYVLNAGGVIPSHELERNETVAFCDVGNRLVH